MDNNRDFINNREVRLFISSTFTDMNEDRDDIINKLIPNIRNKYEGKDITINAIDLRWGITDEDVRNGNVMDICFREIDKCRPFFIGIIGHRYGSPIIMEQLQNDPQTKEYYELIKNQFADYDLSATELEMRYAVLKQKTSNKMDSFFIIKEEKKHNKSFRLWRSKKERDEKKKVDNLIKAITNCKDEGLTIIKYKDSMTTLLELQFEIEKKIDYYFHNTAWNEFDSILSYQQSLMRKLNTINYTRSTDFDFIDNFVKRGDKSVLAIQSDDDSNNVLISNWIEKTQKHIRTIFYFSSTVDKYYNKQSGFKPAEFIYRAISENKETVLNRNIDIWRYVESTVSYVGNDQIVVVLANVDCNDISEHYILTLVHNMLFRKNHEKLKIIVSYRDAKCLERLMRDDNVVKYKLNCFTNEEQQQIITSYLKMYGKQNGLNEEQKILLSSTNVPISGLIAMLDYLATHSTYEKINDDIIKVVNHSTTLLDLFNYLLDDIESTMVTTEIESLRTALCFLSLSYNGLSEDDLMELCEHLTILDIMKIENYFSFQLIQTQGRIIINNKDLINTIRRRYVKKDDEDLRRKLSAHFRRKHTHGSYDELLYQYTMLKDYESLYQLISGNRDAVVYFTRNKILEYVEAWELLWAKDSKKYSLSSLDQCIPIPLNLGEALACIMMAYFLHDYCSEKELSLKFIQKALQYSKIKGNRWLEPLVLFDEAQLYEPASDIESIQKSIELTNAAISKHKEGVYPFICMFGISHINELYTIHQNELKKMTTYLSQLDLCKQYLTNDIIHNKEVEHAYDLFIKSKFINIHSFNYSHALSLLMESLKILKKNKTNDMVLLDAYAGIAYLYYVIGEYDSAIQYFEEMYHCSLKTFCSYNMQLLALFGLFLCYMGKGEQEMAFSFLNRAEDNELLAKEPNETIIKRIEEIRNLYV